MKLPDIQVSFSDCRPCYVNGQRAIFHRWADNARPVVPYGKFADETDERWQCWTVKGVVEFEDGTVARVWPYEIRFLDSRALFDSIAWEQMEAEVENCVSDQS